MVHRQLREAIARFALAAGFVAGCSVGCESESEESSANDEESAQKQGALSESAEDEGEESDDESAEADEKSDDESEPREPGWDVQLSGPVSGTAEGPSVLRKHAGGEDARQIVLAGLPTGGAGPDDQMTFTVSGLGAKPPTTYGADKAQALFESVKLACRHPVEGEDGERTKLRVEFEEFSKSRLRGTLEGTLQCKTTEQQDEEPEPMFVEISGEFFDQ